MNYQGGKALVVKHFEFVINAHSSTGATYWEPFLGGGSVAARVAPRFARSVLSDSMPDLIDMWKALIQGWNPPETLTEEEYRNLRHAASSPLRTFAGFNLSYGGKWWGGYARPHVKQRDRVGAPRRSCISKAAAFSQSEIHCMDYSQITPKRGDVVYCDPPYAGTTAYDAVAEFDHDTFWGHAKRWADGGVHVYVSEFTAPAGWASVWTRTHRNPMRRESTRVEHIFSREMT